MLVATVFFTHIPQDQYSIIIEKNANYTYHCMNIGEYRKM